MKKIASLIFSSVLFMSSTAFAFSDLTESHWAYHNVMNMYNRGFVSGFSDNTFKPNDALTRAQFITVAVKSLGIKEQISEMQFDDIANHWGAEYINIAGSTMSDNTGRFNPDAESLREDVAMAIVKFNKLENLNYKLETLNSFIDSENISENRKKYVAIAVENGYMSGNADGTFNPKKALTRAEGATVIFNILNQEDKIEDKFVNWDGEYISNIDGLVTIKLTKVSETEVNFYIKGNKNGQLFAANENAIINGDVAKYGHDVFDTSGELIFRFDNSDLIIETNGDEEFNVFAGRYKVDDGTVNTIERTVERNPLEGTYLLGEEIEGTPDISNFEELEQFWLNTPLSVSLEISNVSENSANFAIGGFVNRSMVAIMGDLELVDGKWKYFDSFDKQYELEIEIKDNVAIVTGLNEDDAKLTGTYTKKPYNQADEYEKYKEQLDATELYTGIMF